MLNLRSWLAADISTPLVPRVRMLAPVPMVTSPPGPATTIPFQLKSAPSAGLFAATTQASQVTVSAEPGTTLVMPLQVGVPVVNQLFVEFMAVVLFCLKYVAARTVTEPSRANDTNAIPRTFIAIAPAGYPNKLGNDNNERPRLRKVAMSYTSGRA